MHRVSVSRKAAFCTAVEDERIAALSIGTRPDCLPPDVVELLEELNKIKPVLVELGLSDLE